MARLRAIRRAVLLLLAVCVVGVWWSAAASADQRVDDAPARTGCAAGSQVAVIAHPDDDLLFMNPDLLRRVAADGWCTTTIVATAGDAGEGMRYTQDRERGLRAAYATMAGVADDWALDTMSADGRRVERAVLRAAPNVRLEFLRLPDGNLDGTGFRSTGGGSLQQLRSGRTAAVSTVDPWPRAQRYTAAAFGSTLGALIREGAPTVIRTLDYVHAVGTDHDHSDHHAVGRATLAARDVVAPSVPIVPYLGYGSVERPANVAGAALQAKLRAFFAYAPEDRNECQSVAGCAAHPDGRWLRRQYQADGGTDGATAGALPTPSGPAPRADEGRRAQAG